MGKKTNTTTKVAAPAKRAAKPAASKQPASRRTVPVPAKPVKAVAAKTKRATKPNPTNVTTFSSDDVALRAYFIAEKRRQHGLPGDEAHDWIEAERQLLAESKSRRKATPPKV